jgi:Cof subfamily protein (haloacid dehalogenase superfamily)
MKKYSNHIIVLDLDETLLTSNKNITPNTLNTLSRCKEKGFNIAISSTRGYGSCINVANLIDADYICCQAGNMIVDKNKNILYKHPFSTQDISDFIDYFSKYTNNFIIDSDTALYGGVDDDFSHSWGVIYKTNEELKKLPSYKICAYYEPHYKQEMIDYCKKHNFVCIEMRGNDFIMLITPANSDKYYALEQLINILNTDHSKLVVFGDDTSDLLSIQKAGYGVAMANSRQIVLEKAKYITLSNDEDGVAHFLNKTFEI